MLKETKIFWSISIIVLHTIVAIFLLVITPKSTLIWITAVADAATLFAAFFTERRWRGRTGVAHSILVYVVSALALPSLIAQLVGWALNDDGIMSAAVIVRACYAPLLTFFAVIILYRYNKR